MTVTQTSLLDSSSRKRRSCVESTMPGLVTNQEAVRRLHHVHSTSFQGSTARITPPSSVKLLYQLFFPEQTQKRNRYRLPGFPGTGAGSCFKGAYLWYPVSTACATEPVTAIRCCCTSQHILQLWTSSNMRNAFSWCLNLQNTASLLPHMINME